MRRSPGAVALAVLAGATTLLSGVSRCERPTDGGTTVTTPSGWRPITLDDAVTMAVPPDATERDVQPIDSIFGLLRGPGYEIVYDYGRFGERLSDHADRPGYTHTPRVVGGRPGTEVSFRGDGHPWVKVRIIQVRDGDDTLTVQMSCAEDEVCRLADLLFDSVRFV